MRCCVKHDRQIVDDFLPARTGEESDPGLAIAETVGTGVFLPRIRRQRQCCEWVADEFGVDVAGAVEGGFEGEDDQHAVDEALYPAQAAALPGPELRADEPEDGDAEALAVHGEAEVDVGEVDEDGERGWVAFDGADECAVLRVDVEGVAEDFGEAHVGDVFGTDDALLAGGFHGAAAEAGEAGSGDAAVELGDDGGAVVIA